MPGNSFFTKQELERACALAPLLRMSCQPRKAGVAAFCDGEQAKSLLGMKFPLKWLLDKRTKGFAREHRATPLILPAGARAGADLDSAFLEFYNERKYWPRLAIAEGVGVFALGPDSREAAGAAQLFSALSSGAEPPEAASEDSAISLRRLDGRLSGKVVLVTGGAQGFGKGIADALADQGAYVVVADINAAGAEACAAEFAKKYGIGAAAAVRADVSDEESVKEMVQAAVLRYGGLDALISNAGIAIAGDLEEMTKEKFERVTSINYTGYFLCAKYASAPMKIQRGQRPGYTADIIQINSKSGLEGSNKNFAYAGSKFGGIGLTQSFAMELAPYGIKVNAICPGNFLDGPLWADPDRGLFRQYLEAGKVPGAKTVGDVRRHYESRVPMNRGCAVADVARAIMYVIEQQYETGQAIPVTGGQVMLR
ncbi:MAG: SDR family NAD(P)-dependent oxidoreductase [Clostridiales bacterium]|jgi:NAD(P)-dependent dehydrogenase (short-subunit alcohol dehydrogenase family)|nr:SDR family NAD(P)-dependent oxidoreductase [Clostridiales bacterium]